MIDWKKVNDNFCFESYSINGKKSPYGSSLVYHVVATLLACLFLPRACIASHSSTDDRTTSVIASWQLCHPDNLHQSSCSVRFKMLMSKNQVSPEPFFSSPCIHSVPIISNREDLIKFINSTILTIERKRMSKTMLCELQLVARQSYLAANKVDRKQ